MQEESPLYHTIPPFRSGRPGTWATRIQRRFGSLRSSTKKSTSLTITKPLVSIWVTMCESSETGLMSTRVICYPTTLQLRSWDRVNLVWRLWRALGYSTRQSSHRVELKTESTRHDY